MMRGFYASESDFSQYNAKGAFQFAWYNLSGSLICTPANKLLTSLCGYVFVQIENGMLTPTMKVRRDVVTQVYKQQIDPLFK